MRKIADYKVVSFEWLDSCGDRGWSLPEPKEDKKHMLIKSVGLLAYMNREVIAISTSRNRDGKFMDLLVIPRSVVRKLRYL